jgi:hypothetical protein
MDLALIARRWIKVTEGSRSAGRKPSPSKAISPARPAARRTVRSSQLPDRNPGITTQTTSGVSVSYIRDPSGNLIAMRTAGQSFYYTGDAQGSVIALTDGTQARSDLHL